MVVIIEFSDGERKAFGAVRFGEWIGFVAGIELDVESADFGFDISEVVFFLFDDDAVFEQLILDGFDLFGIFFLLFWELFNQEIGLCL
jgi:hypothetical protein